MAPKPFTARQGAPHPKRRPFTEVAIALYERHTGNSPLLRGYFAACARLDRAAADAASSELSALYGRLRLHNRHCLRIEEGQDGDRATIEDMCRSCAVPAILGSCLRAVYWLSNHGEHSALAWIRLAAYLDSRLAPTFGITEGSAGDVFVI